MLLSEDLPVTPDSTTSEAKSRLKEASHLINQLVRFHPKLFAIAVSGATLFALCTVASSIGLRWMIDRVILVRFEQNIVDPIVAYHLHATRASALTSNE